MFQCPPCNCRCVKHTLEVRVQVTLPNDSYIHRIGFRVNRASWMPVITACVLELQEVGLSHATGSCRNLTVRDLTNLMDGDSEHRVRALFAQRHEIVMITNKRQLILGSHMGKSLDFEEIQSWFSSQSESHSNDPVGITKAFPKDLLFWLLYSAVARGNTKLVRSAAELAFPSWISF